MRFKLNEIVRCNTYIAAVSQYTGYYKIVRVPSFKQRARYGIKSCDREGVIVDDQELDVDGRHLLRDPASAELRKEDLLEKSKPHHDEQQKRNMYSKGNPYPQHEK